MGTTDGRTETGEPEEGERPVVAVHECSPDRVVFIEEENADAWIATDLSVDLPD